VLVDDRERSSRQVGDTPEAGSSVRVSMALMGNSRHVVQPEGARGAPPLRHLRSSIGVPEVLREIVVRWRDGAREPSGAPRELKEIPPARRREAIRAYLFSNPSNGRATLSEIVSESDAIFLDRVEHGPDNISEGGFDVRLAAFLASHPEVLPPNPQTLSSGTVVTEGQDIASPSSANPIP
jgi:hypothetical protein